MWLNKAKYSTIKRIIIVFHVVLVLVQSLASSTCYALTGGPTQPEVHSFSPISASDLVDPSTGDFSYNIPLLDVGGYPINMSYQSGITMDQEASWVGLGWNLNPGAMTRTMRGLPDDFKGANIVGEDSDVVEKTFSMKKNITYGVRGGAGVELLGANLSFNLGAGFNYNTYNGFGFEQIINVGISSGIPNNESYLAGLGVTISSGTDGTQITPDLSFSKKMKSESHKTSISSRLSFPMSSTEGLKSLDFGASISFQGNNKPDFQNLSLGGSVSFVSFASNTHYPKMDVPRLDRNSTFTGTLGVYVTGVNTSFNLVGYRTSNSVDYSNLSNGSKTFKRQAYGYLYSKQSKSNSLLDFNREKDLVFKDDIPNLPLTSQTFDLFSATAHGLSAMFKPSMGHVNYVHDAYNESGGKGKAFGVEVGVGFGEFQLGADGEKNSSTSKVSKWKGGNKEMNKYRTSGSSLDFEQVYFKTIGENTPVDLSHFKSLGAFAPISANLNDGKIDGVSSDIDLTTTSDYPSYNHSKERLNNSSFQIKARENREVRKTVLSYKTKVQLEQLGKTANPNAKDHHIAEMTVLNSEGTRYVYGKAVYNLFQEELMMNISSLPPSQKDRIAGQVDFLNVTNLENHKSTLLANSNSSSHDNYFDLLKTPAYAHSFLLTEVLSNDYIDLTDNGPSDDDFGTYTKFEYEKVHDNYKWRIPWEEEKMNFNEGLLFDKNDDKGVSISGQKEIVYLNKITTKTHEATFFTSQRHDAKEAGSQGSYGKALHKLDKIELRSIHGDLIKTVHFVYSYNACPEVPNHLGSTDLNGKLRLDKVFFTYGKSEMGRLNPYEFTYSDNNPMYHSKAYDRWGNYSKEIVEEGIPMNGINSSLSSTEFPYVNQQISGNFTADDNSNAWELRKIKLPSSGEIIVAYEADDYAYVQDKKANEMFRLMGSTDADENVESFDETDFSDQLYSLGDNKKEKAYYVKLKNPVLKTDDWETKDKKKALQKYFGDYIKWSGTDISPGNLKLYFKFLVKLDAEHDGNTRFDEYISGYADVKDVAFVKLEGDYYQWAKITLKNTSSNDYNPISTAAWNFIRINAQRYAINDYSVLQTSGDNEESLRSVLLEIKQGGFIQGLMNFISGPYDVLASKGSSQIFVPEKSMFRLYSPNGKKKGGGKRVSSYSVRDNWSENKTYTTKYTYENADGTSTGVACYEPILGGDENVLRQPIIYSEEKLLVPDNEYFIEAPFGESFFPAPSVVYSKVQVETDYSDAEARNINVNKMGSTVHEYYTAKDFPVLTSNTSIQKERDESGLAMKILNVKTDDHTTTSQGYVIELNDMHGKQKGVKSYTKDGFLTSSVAYKYVEHELSKPNKKRLGNFIDVAQRDSPSIENKLFGVDYELVADFRQYSTKNESFGLSAQFGNVGWIIPFTTAFPKYNNQNVSYKSSVLTKVVNRYGILKEVVKIQDGIEQKEENVMWDAKTGEVLVTKSINEFEDEIFSYTVPAYWEYAGMDMAYKNIGKQLKLTNLDASGKLINVAGYDPGDQFLIDYGNGFGMAWLVEKETPNGLYLVDDLGDEISDFTSAQIMRSGKRNLYNRQYASFQLPYSPSSSRHNPLDLTGLGVLQNLGYCTHEEPHIDQPFHHVVATFLNHSGFTTYKDEWETTCSCLTNSSNSSSLEDSPYKSGLKGNWRAWKTYDFDSKDRFVEHGLSTDVDETSLIKTDISSNGYFQLLNDSVRYNTITKYLPNSLEVENEDIYGVYASAHYGYKNTLPISVSNNAKYSETWFESFDDPGSCEAFGPINIPSATGVAWESNEAAHTGDKSLFLAKNSNVQYNITIE